jgi:hypothetical protein
MLAAATDGDATTMPKFAPSPSYSDAMALLHQRMLIAKSKNNSPPTKAGFLPSGQIFLPLPAVITSSSLYTTATGAALKRTKAQRLAAFYSATAAAGGRGVARNQAMVGVFLPLPAVIITSTATPSTATAMGAALKKTKAQRLASFYSATTTAAAERGGEARKQAMLGINIDFLRSGQQFLPLPSLANTTNTISMSKVWISSSAGTVRVVGQKLPLSRMPLVLTPARLKLLYVCDLVCV